MKCDNIVHLNIIRMMPVFWCRAGHLFFADPESECDMKSNKFKTVALLSLPLHFFILLAGMSWAGEIEAITKPSADIELSFVQPGKIKEVKVKEGDLVKQGDLLAGQEDEIERIQKKILAGRADNTTQIEMAKTELLQKEKDLKKMDEARREGAVTSWEADHARLAADTSLLSLKLAEFEHDQDILEEQQINAVIDRLHLRSPIDGVVEHVAIEVGESLLGLAPVMRIIKIDPLLIDAAVPLTDAKLLESGQQAIITYADGNVEEGYIDNISSLADAAATTLRVRIKVANTGGRPAGIRVFVSFAGTEKE